MGPANVFWNEGVSSTSAGIDILGIRGADQAHEGRWTGGITTISARARYLTLLPWFLDEWYRRAQARGDLQHDETALTAALRRMEQIVFLATEYEARSGAPGDGRAVLGSELWEDMPAALAAGHEVTLETNRGGASLGTYVQPCIRLRLVADGRPLRVPPRGQEVAEIQGVSSQTIRS